MAAELSHLLSEDQKKHKYEKTESYILQSYSSKSSKINAGTKKDLKNPIKHPRCGDECYERIVSHDVIISQHP